MSDDLLGAAVDGRRHGRRVFWRRDRHHVEARADVRRPVRAQHSPEVKLVLGLGRSPSDRVENAVVGSNPVPIKFTVCQNLRTVTSVLLIL